MAVAPANTMQPSSAPQFSYVLPLRSEQSLADSELTPYLAWLAVRAETLVIDGSPTPVFEAHATAWGHMVRHVAPAPELTTPMGKVGGVLTGVRLASHDCLVIADDDVRYDDCSLAGVIGALQSADVVRPQNYFSPLPWHACWDTGRSLLNRLHGGDWPGTLGVRRSVLLRTGGYDGSAMFENLELVRTIVAAGGREVAPLDVYVARQPSSTRHFLSQRVRQAYDELARPRRLAWQLAVLPLTMASIVVAGWPALGAVTVSVALLAEAGRQRAGGARYFPVRASLLAPAWVAERAVCSWLALGSRVLFGGVRYRGTVLRHAATPLRVLRSRHAPGAATMGPRATPRQSA